MKNALREWLKNLIKEVISENFPPMYITIEGRPIQKIKLENCRFNNSKIHIEDILPDAVLELDSCVINTDGMNPDEVFVTRVEGKKRKRKK